MVDVCSMRFPTLFVNHGGGPMPLLGRQPQIVRHMKEAVQKYVPEKPKSIVILTAHWEASPIQISNHNKPRPLYFDYGGFPPETYQYKYPSPVAPDLSLRIQELMTEHGIESKLEPTRGFDHGVFVPLMVMYPDADIPVVSVSLDASLDADINMKIGEALSPLRDEGVLIIGSGFTFHNMPSFFRPTAASIQASKDFNDWLKDGITNRNISPDELRSRLANWKKAPGGLASHPREEHLIPLFMTAAAGGFSGGQVIWDAAQDSPDSDHVFTGYVFEYKSYLVCKEKKVNKST